MFEFPRVDLKETVAPVLLAEQLELQTKTDEKLCSECNPLSNFHLCLKCQVID